MGNETAITNINQHTYVELIQLQSTLGIIYNRLGAIESLTSKDDIEGLISELELLREKYAFMSSLIENEIEFQNGQIIEKDMEQAVEAIHEEFLGVKE